MSQHERQWQWNEPGDHGEPVVRTITESEIREQYWPWWQEQMRKVGKEDQISFEMCVDDFCVVHWAWPC